jgi:hypothetical protein
MRKHSSYASFLYLERWLKGSSDFSLRGLGDFSLFVFPLKDNMIRHD